MNHWCKLRILALAAVLGLSACGKKNPVNQVEAPPTDAEPVVTAPTTSALEALPPLNSLSAEALGWPSDSTVEARIRRLQALEEEGDPDRVRDILQLALADADAQVRRAAIDQIDLLPLAKAAPLLENFFRIEPVPDVRHQALAIVSKWKGPEALPILTTAMASKDMDTKLIASSQLTLRADKPSLEILLTGLKESDPGYREELNDKIEYLVDRRFQTYEEAAAWWSAHGAEYDRDLFKKE